jgi:hypothetical protein
MSTLAVFLVLGGGAYAAVQLPARSVGTRELRTGAVTRSKLASRSVSSRKLRPGAVTLGRLSPGVRALLARSGSTGAAGTAGPAGARGPAGPGAARIAFAADAAATPPRTAVVDVPGLRIDGACEAAGGMVSLPLSITAAEDSQAQEMISIDTGPDPTNPTTHETNNLQFDLVGGTPLDTGGPSIGGADYFRVLATLILSAPSRTITVNAVLIVNAATQRCTMSGTAVTAT